VNNDWIELLESFVAHKVEFLVVGAWAMAYHGQPRYTGDLDLFFRPSTRNKTAPGRPKDLLDIQILEPRSE